jgi:hypothetical protein
MSSEETGMKLKVLTSAAAIVVATIGMGFASSGDLVAGASTLTAIIEPASNAPLAQWQAWADQVNAVTSSTNWAAVAASTGYTLISSSIVPTNNAAIGIPAGVTLNSVSLDLRRTLISNGTATVVPNYSSCPVLTHWNGASVTNGYECVGIYSVGLQAYAGAAYTYETSGSVTGHEELGTVASGCSPGTPAANGSTLTLNNGNVAEVVTPTSGSNHWTATWWKGTSSPYTSWGTVCGTY